MTSIEREDFRFKRYCCVYGCMNKGNKHSELSFFNVPKEIERRRKWLLLADREDILDETNSKKRKHYVVCSEHFDDSAFIYTKRLKTDAVPTKSLPNQDGRSESPDLNKAVKSTPRQALPGSSRDLPPDSSNEEDVSIFIYSRTNAQAQPKPKETEVEDEIDLEPEKTKIKLETASTATQTDLNETTDQMTQATFTFCEKCPRERGPEEEAEIVARKRRRRNST